MQRLPEDASRRSLLGEARRVHHVHAVGVARDDAEVVRDHDHRDVELARQLLHEMQDLRLDGDVEGGGRLVGDDELGIAREPDGDHHALAHAARELVRVLSEPPRGIGDADHLQELDGARPRLVLAHPLVDEKRLHDLQPDGQHRVERGHRLLEDHRDVAAAQRAHLVLGEREEIASFEQDAPVRDASGRLGEEAHDRERRYRFAAAGFADQRDHLARIDLPAHALHGADDAARRDEMHVQVFDRQQRSAVGTGNASGGAGDGLIHGLAGLCGKERQEPRARQSCWDGSLVCHTDRPQGCNRPKVRCSCAEGLAREIRATARSIPSCAALRARGALRRPPRADSGGAPPHESSGWRAP